MKKNFVLIFFIICGLSSSLARGDSSCAEDKELAVFIKHLEQKLVSQEKKVVCLKAKFSGLINQKKGLLEEIERDKRRLEEQRLAEQMKQKKAVRSQESSAVKGRERQMDYAFEQAEKNLPKEAGDVDYLASLIKRQRELCATVIKLEQDIALEEKNLNLLKEKRKILTNPE